MSLSASRWSSASAPRPAAGRAGLEVVDALPAVLLAEYRARLREPPVERAEPPAPRPLVLVVGIAQRVVVLVRLPCPLRRVRAVLVHGPETPRGELRHVVRRLAVDEPLGQDVADGAARAEARVREPGREPEPGHAGDGTEEGTAVRRDALGAVDEVGQLGLGEHGHATDRALEDLAKQLPVRREQLLREVPGHAAHRPGHRVLLEAADQVPADLLAHVDEVLRIAQAGRRAGQLAAGERLRG